MTIAKYAALRMHGIVHEPKYDFDIDTKRFLIAVAEVFDNFDRVWLEMNTAPTTDGVSVILDYGTRGAVFATYYGGLWIGNLSVYNKDNIHGWMPLPRGSKQK